MDADAPVAEDESLWRRRRAAAVQLYTQQLGVAHLRSKAVAALGPPPLDPEPIRQRSSKRTRRIAADAQGRRAAATAAGDQGGETIRLVYGPGALSLDSTLDQQRARLLQAQRDHAAAAAANGARRQRRRPPAAVELPGFEARPEKAAAERRAEAAAARAGEAPAAAEAADRGPPPGWVRVNADGEEVEAAPVDAEDFVMEAADEAAFDEEEWV